MAPGPARSNPVAIDRPFTVVELEEVEAATVGGVQGENIG